MPAERILIVEDEKDVRDVLAEMTWLFGFKPSLASDAEEAWKMIESSTYDLIIADLKLPGKDGIELVRMIRLHGLRTPALIIAGVDMEKKSGVVKGLANCGFVQKPFKIDDIRERIGELLEKAKQELQKKKVK